MLDARLPLGSCAATPSRAMIGTSPRCSRKKPSRVMMESKLPKRRSTRSRKLARTDSPTASAPPSTPVAVATPSSTARFVRQYHRRLRANKVEVRMPQLVSNRKLRGQIRTMGHHDQDGFLPAVQLQQESADHAGGRLIEVTGGLVA